MHVCVILCITFYRNGLFALVCFFSVTVSTLLKKLEMKYWGKTIENRLLFANESKMQGIMTTSMTESSFSFYTGFLPFVLYCF